MKFSLIIPTYNRARLLAGTVRTALEQKHGEFEVIVVDDGSTDDTPSVMAQIRDPRLRYFRKENGERAAARNFGAAKATGDYLNFFDSDDRLLPTHLKEAERFARAEKKPEVFALGFRIENSAGRVFRTIDHLPDPMNLEFLRGNPLGCNPVFVRADVFRALPFHEERALAGSEDILLWLQLSARYPFRFCPSVTSVHLDHEDRSVYGFTEAKLSERNRLLIEHLEKDEVFMRGYGQHLPQIRAQRMIYSAVHLALAGQRRLALKYLLGAATTRFRSIFHLGTAGALKRIACSLFGAPYKPG